ncbi:MAG: polysaccharide deacetylase family protein [Chloroflexi bacterium]|nr:polysaccharide deacetylase family protein [Chloroflexota bacterium]
MRYANLSFKKITGMLGIIAALSFLVATTAVTWLNVVGNLSIPAVESQIATAGTAWWYRIEYNAQFAPRPSATTASLLAAIGLTPPIQVANATSAGAQSIPVLLYHGIVPVSQSPDETSIATFKNQMFTLKNAGWQTVSIEDFVAAIQGRMTLPQKSFLLTFDDGRQDAYTNATPILQALGYRAVMYVITGHSLGPNNQKSRYYVTESQLKQMLASGAWELQSHSDIGHAQYPVDASGTLGDFFGAELWLPAQNQGESSSSYAARVYGDLENYFTNGGWWPLVPGVRETKAQYERRIQTDLQNAKSTLQNKLGVDAISFAYPYNDFGADVKTDVVNGAPALIGIVNSIYQVSFFQWYPSLGASENYPAADHALLRRIEPRPDWTAAYLLQILDAGQAKSLPYSMVDPVADGWNDAWGAMIPQGDTFALAASPATNGAMSVLDGTRLWGNYLYTAGFDWNAGKSISLIGRYGTNASAPNSITPSYVACNFGNGSVRLEERSGSGTTVIAQNTDAAIGPGSSKTAGIRFINNTASCLWNGMVIVTGTLDRTAPGTGGIGMEVWNTVPNNANLTVRTVSVASR